MRYLSFRSSWSSDRGGYIVVLPFQLYTITFARDLQSDAASTERLQLVALIPGLPTGPTSSPRSFMCRH
jgi:hypothetical protein